jgi:urea transport system ATP-binding protein
MANTGLQSPTPSSQSLITHNSSLIVARDVRAGYGKKEILRGVTLAANKGELVAIIGPNGAGKSTLLKVIAGFLRPTAGTVLLNGRDITRLAPHERVRAGIGYFMQGGRAFPSLTVRENLSMAGDDNGSGKGNLEQVMEVFPKLKEISGRRAGLLSGGERQALALVMTLVRRPTVLLLDEPSAGLSPRLAQEMLDKIRDISQSWNLTALMVEQNIREAIGLCSRVVCLTEGQMAKDSGKPRELLVGHALEDLFLGDRKHKPALSVTTEGTIGGGT